MNSEFLMLPHFDPTIFTFGNSNIGLRWYGLTYLLDPQSNHYSVDWHDEPPANAQR